ncbi:MAG: hypothetical protein Q9227_007552 [Pyrenula ochraceoflavens]
MGLPSSSDVGILAQMIQNLRSKAEADLSITISSAVAGVPHLVALYQDDIQDAFEYLNLEYLTPKNYFRPLVWETAAAFAGHGFGLCTHPEDTTSCQSEEAGMKEQTVLSVHYSRSALTTSLAILRTATDLWEPAYRHREDFSLGHDSADKDEYWNAVKKHLQLIMREYPHYERPHRIVLTGDEALGNDQTFSKVLHEAMVELMGEMPPVLTDDVELVVAKGAAEFARRRDLISAVSQSRWNREVGHQNFI